MEHFAETKNGAIVRAGSVGRVKFCLHLTGQRYSSLTVLYTAPVSEVPGFLLKFLVLMGNGQGKRELEYFF